MINSFYSFIFCAISGPAQARPGRTGASRQTLKGIEQTETAKYNKAQRKDLLGLTLSLKSNLQDRL